MSRTGSQVSITTDNVQGCNCTSDEIMALVAGRFSDTQTVNFTHDGTLFTYSADVVTNKSVTSTATGVELQGDSSSPGINKYYGTDASGIKGFHVLPSGSTQSVYTYASLASFPATGTIDTLYIAANTSIGYAWDVLTSSYLPIGGSSSSQILESTGRLNFTNSFSTTSSTWDSNFDSYMATNIVSLPQYNANPSYIAKLNLMVSDRTTINLPNINGMFYTEVNVNAPINAPHAYGVSHYSQFPVYTSLNNNVPLIGFSSINTSGGLTVTINSWIIVPTGVSPYIVGGGFGIQTGEVTYNYSI